jgi:phosphoribosylformylglycinamidine cyclo-ligase
VFSPAHPPTGVAGRRRGGRTRTYAASGVDRAEIAASLRALLGAIRSRAPSTHGRPVELPGHYAGVIRIGAQTLAATTDTVGTKVLLAEQLDRWEEVGEDLVAINVNDLAAVGARPAGIVDTIVCARPDRRRFRAIGRGIDRGLRAARCSLLGGETAVVPELVRGIDLGATALGFFPGRRRPITGARVRPGDRILGIP